MDKRRLDKRRLDKRRLGPWILLVAAGLTALPLLAQTFSETTSTVVVEVPVQVIRDGEPVRGLTQADFAVFDGRKKQTITGFEVIDLVTTVAAEPSAKAQAPALSAAARRHFLLLFDLAFSDPKSVVLARKAAAGMVDELHPTDLVAVATYSSLKGPQLVLGFTPDRAQISAAITTLGSPEMLGRNADPLRLVLTDARASMAQQPAGGSSAAAQRGQVHHLEAGESLLLTTVIELEVGGGEAAHRLAVADHLHRHFHHDDLRALDERLGHRHGGSQSGGQEAEQPSFRSRRSFRSPLHRRLSVVPSALLRAQRTGPATETSQPLRYSPCGWVTATGWSGAAASGLRRATRTPASTAAAKKICRKSLVSTAPLQLKVSRKPPGATRRSASRFKSL